MTLAEVLRADKDPAAGERNAGRRGARASAVPNGRGESRGATRAVSRHPCRAPAWRLALALIATALVACAPPPLRVGTSGDYPPFSFRDEAGRLRGFDVDVARAYARDRGRRLALVAFRWPELERRLAAGDFDVAMSGVTVRADRLARFPMTAAVARSDAVVLVRESEATRPFDREGAAVAVNRGGHLERVARRAIRRARVVAVDDNRSLPGLLAAGRVDAIVAGSLEAERLGPGLRRARVLRRDRKAYLVREPELARDLDRWLDARERDGWLARLRRRWLGASAELGLPPSDARLVDLLARRLSLMPLVAAVKRRRGLPIEAPGREAAIEARSRAFARTAGLDEGAYLALVRAEVEAAKAVQRALRPGEALPSFDLVRDLRPAIDRIDDALRRELALGGAPRAGEPELLAALRELARLPGLDEAHARSIVRALLSLRPRPPGVNRAID